MFFACLANSLGLAQTSGISTLVHRQALPWGNADITRTTDGMNIRFNLHPQPKLIVQDSSVSLKKIPSYSCFIQIPTGKKVVVQIQKYTSHHITPNNISASTISALSKLARNSSTPLVQLQGYHWFRGKRLAQLNISIYTNNAQSIQAIDTIGVALEYISSSASNNVSMNTAEDKQFKSILNTLVHEYRRCNHFTDRTVKMD